MVSWCSTWKLSQIRHSDFVHIEIVVCRKCKEEDELAENFAEDYDIPKGSVIYKSVGCKACSYSGYSGRRSIGELLVMNDSIKELLKTTTDEHTIKTQLENLKKAIAD